MLKKLICAVLLLLIVFIPWKSMSYTNTRDGIGDKDEAIIKEFRSHHGYSKNELKNLEIKYLGTVDDYKIYYVPYKNDEPLTKDLVKEGYTFPFKCQTRIIGINSYKLYTIGNLIYETQINIKQLYEILPEEFKTPGTTPAKILTQEEITKLKANLQAITSTKTLSSNPLDQIKGHEKEYNEIIGLGKPAVDYFISEYKKGNLDGSNAWITAWICNEILGDKNPIKIWEQDNKNGWSYGIDWYEKYLKAMTIERD